MPKPLALIFGFLILTFIVCDYGEIIVLLTNKKRRAIHDFVAGTVVIHDPRLPKTLWRNL
jgi:uncharacterized RDD family membrane protein YckC